jgi:hypothetical protein
MKGLRQVAQSVAGGLILYGAVWMLEHTEVSQERLAAAIAALAQLGRQWVSPLAIGSIILTILAAASYIAARILPVPRGIGLDRSDARLILGRMGRLLLGAALVGALAATSFFVMADSAAWGITLLAASSLIAARWLWRSARWLNRLLNPGIY